MNFLPQNIDDYAVSHTSKESELLAMLNRQTHLKVLAPRMLSGHLQGRVLSMMSHLMQPKLVLEIGTYTGYSALCLAEGLQKEGKVITIEIDPEIADFASEFIGKSKYKDCIEIRVGNALEIIDTINEPIDLVFIDADKTNYINYFEKVKPKLRVGGVIIADNVLWSGKVASVANEKDKDTKVLQEFNKIVQDDPNFENVLLPIRDGLMMARKI